MRLTRAQAQPLFDLSDSREVGRKRRGRFLNGILHHLDDDLMIQVSYKELTGLLYMSIPSLYQTVRELKELGIIEVDRPGFQGANRYRLLAHTEVGHGGE